MGKLDLQQKKLNNQKKKIEKERKALDADKKKTATGWRDLERAKKKWADEKDTAAAAAQSSKMRSARHQQPTANKKFQDQFFEMKKKYDQEAKKARDYKKRMD